VRATILIAAAVAAAALWRAAASVPVPSTARSPLFTPASAAVGAGAAREARSVAAAANAASIVSRVEGSPDAATAPPDARGAAAASALSRTEAAVREARRRGKGEQEVHRLRSAGMPAAQVDALARMEAAETSWRQRVEALQAACAANIGCDDARASFTREELARTEAYAPPTLRR
jgi:hypothetical protein